MREWLEAQRGRWKELIELYGSVAIGTYFAIFLLSIGGFWIAIRAGVDVGSSVAELGTLGAAWAATKLLQPVRIALSLVLTPPIAHLIGKRRPAGPPS